MRQRSCTAAVLPRATSSPTGSLRARDSHVWFDVDTAHGATAEHLEQVPEVTGKYSSRAATTSESPPALPALAVTTRLPVGSDDTSIVGRPKRADEPVVCVKDFQILPDTCLDANWPAQLGG